ncbi:MULTISPECIES: hypothetical protein [Streptomyces]|uniref:Phage integrase family protein n=1 Tax=Streptomyces spororaveus TaxID=284039 RepID=A0ABQ3T525_9ACTN|nr:hypothetical protein [Streptomyces spororaveus]GHI75272.1 hypothetical protein Sspor_08330 [Streptomyces spororaveus]
MAGVGLELRFHGGRRRKLSHFLRVEHGTVDGYLLHHPMDPTKPYLAYYLQNQWQRIKRAGEVDVPDGLVIYSLRHFFASKCLTNGIPITDVAEWICPRASASPSGSTAISCPAPSAKPPRSSTWDSLHDNPAEPEGGQPRRMASPRSRVWWPIK